MEKEKSVFDELNAINVNDKVEKKKDLSYLSWAYAWAELKKHYPNATYEIERFGEDKKPYIYDEKLGYMVFTKMTINELTHEMWLPVMDGANKSMKNAPYKYKTKYGDKVCEAASMFDINKTIMRCLVKNIGMFGLGLYIYAGEDLPEDDSQQPPVENKGSNTPRNNKNASVSQLQEKQTYIHSFYTEHKNTFTPVLKGFLQGRKLSELPEQELDGIIEVINTSRETFKEVA